MRTHYCSTTRLTLLLVAIGLTLGSLLPTAVFAAASEDKIGGTMRAVIDGTAVHFPSLKSDITAHLDGDLATVTIVQSFINPSEVPLNASYLFPLNKDAAVHSMQMEVGNERVVSVIKKKPEARARFEQAKREGRAATLLTQHRPNMFTQELANLMPGEPVKVTLEYSQVVPRVDGSYELVVPLVVGPRYMPKEQSVETATLKLQSEQKQHGQESGEWQFDAPPDYPQVGGLHIPDTIDKDRVSIKASLQAGFPIKDMVSRTHALRIEGDGMRKSAQLMSGRIADNRDFVLRYKLAGKTLEAGLLVHSDQRGDFVSLLLEPPEAPAESDIMPREMVFLLDTSGSMNGLPMATSKTFMRHAIQSLRDTDYFRIIHFASSAGELTSGPIPATALNRKMAVRYVDALRAGGGTEVMSGIRQAFAVPPRIGTLRIVTFLTDGYIGNEGQILNAIAHHREDARIYAFGVGTAVNRYFLTEIARMGRGYARFVDPTEEGHKAAIDLAKRLDGPLLTDISVDWGTLDVQHRTPDVIPDLFRGDSLRIMAKTKASPEPGSSHRVTITGLANGRKATLPLNVQIANDIEASGSQALPLIWARTRISEYMRQLTRPQRLRSGGLSNKALQDRVTALGLSFSLMTQWTSFVAVSEEVVNHSPVESVDTLIPLNQVEGVSERAYDNVKTAPKAPLQVPHTLRSFAANPYVTGNGVKGAGLKRFGGGATPEPGVYGGLMILSLVALIGLLWRRREYV